MNKEIDYLEDDILEDFGELKELDFGNRKGRTENEIDEDEVQKKIEYVDENLWGKLEKSGKTNFICKRYSCSLQLYERILRSSGIEKQSLLQL